MLRQQATKSVAISLGNAISFLVLFKLNLICLLNPKHLNFTASDSDDQIKNYYFLELKSSGEICSDLCCIQE